MTQVADQQITISAGAIAAIILGVVVFIESLTLFLVLRRRGRRF